MAFINPGLMSSMAGQGGGGLNTSPSPGFFQRMLGAMGGGGNPQPVGGPTGMQRFGGALGSALAAPGMSTMPNAGMGMMRPMPIGGSAQGPMISPGQNGGGIAQPVNPLWQRYLSMLQSSPQPMSMGAGGSSPMGSPTGGGMPFGGGMRNMGAMKPAAY